MLIEITAQGTKWEEKGQWLVLNGELTEEHAQPIREAWGTDTVKKLIVTLADDILSDRLNPAQRESGYTVWKVKIVRNRTTNADPKTMNIHVQ